MGSIEYDTVRIFTARQDSLAMGNHMRSSIIAGLLALVGGAGQALAQPWLEIESALLTDHVQLTFPEQFFKAGEAYFDPAGEWVIFQAVPTPQAGQEPDLHYSMYVAPLTRDDHGRVTGLGESTRVSPPDSANTCGWFHPSEPGVVLFGSTLVAPSNKEVPGFKRDRQKYLWSFPEEMEVVTTTIDGGRTPETVFSRPGYDAECSFSADGRFILYANVDMEKSAARLRSEVDIFIYDTKTREHRALVVAPGYDGGPFFSPDGKSICYRTDRKKKDHLQVFIAELEFDSDGVPVGVLAEHAITDNSWVNWAPYFHPSGRFMIFTGSGPYHQYDVYSIELDPPENGETGYTMDPGDRTVRRVTFAGGFDGLPAFNADGSLMMWTSQRTLGDDEAKSQLWIARVNVDADWTGSLSESQAIAIAHAAIGEDPNRIAGVAHLQGKDWLYEATIMGGERAGPISVLVRPDGTSAIIEADGS